MTRPAQQRICISIHAPREGRDRQRGEVRKDILHFNPRAPRGARQGLIYSDMGIGYISIHAPREGRDICQLLHILVQEDFNPRAPRGARPPQIARSTKPIRISIHAPREGRDGDVGRGAGDQTDFNPRAPRGARPFSWSATFSRFIFQSTRPARGATTASRGIDLKSRLISIHAPREGRDDS